MKTIALFGGSFDPPHIAHEMIVNALLRTKEIDKVIVMPTFLNPFKSSSVAPAEHRLKWLRKIFSDFDNVEISDFEVSMGKKIATIESVKHLLKSYQKIYLVIGADNLSTLHKWHEFDRLKELVTFIVASREGVDIPDSFMKLTIDMDISSTTLRQKLDKTKLPKRCAGEIQQYYEGKQ
ncbi:MAG: nicotinate (nicotinamide) nucleotide adenylyltransferase [Campylobacterota bacterium]|nr:nicotinate (nicotinamide) nucleotide adenylyltransferase [Campylobacterota bacterium]